MTLRRQALFLTLGAVCAAASFRARGAYAKAYL